MARWTQAFDGIRWNFAELANTEVCMRIEAQILSVLHIWGFGLRILYDRDTLITNRTTVEPLGWSDARILESHGTQEMWLPVAAWGSRLIPPEPRTGLFSNDTNFSHSSFSLFHFFPVPFLHIILTLHICPDDLSGLSPAPTTLRASRVIDITIHSPIFIQLLRQNLLYIGKQWPSAWKLREGWYWPRHWGMKCKYDTPHGQPAGLIKQLLQTQYQGLCF